MLTYLIRRLLLMIPTILGISFVTLGLIHLAPGDPVQAQVGGLQMGKGGLTAEEIEAMRRTYYLHLPILLNFTPEDASTVNEDLLDDVTSSDEDLRDRSIRRVAQRGSIVIPAAAERLGEVSGKEQAALVAGLSELSKRIGLDDELAKASDPVAFWQGWAQDNQAMFTRGAAQETVAAMALGDEAAAEKARQLDTFALAAAFERLEDAPRAGPEAMRITEFLSSVTGTDITIRDGDDETAIDRAYDAWHRWWQPRRSDFTELAGGKSVTAFITETQYFKWVMRIFTLDFGISSRDSLPVKDKLWDRLQRTLQLAILSLFISYLIAIPLGIFSAIRQYSLGDQIVSLLLFILYSLPSFWVAMLLQTYVTGVPFMGIEALELPLAGLTSENYDTLSLGGQIWDRATHLVLPVFCLTYASLASLSRYQRVGMLDVIRADYIRTARAKGLSERVVVLKHALRNSVIPIVTLMGLQLPFLVSGAVIVEMIFQIQGMGLETLEAIRTRDLNWIMASVTLTAVMTMVGILVSDVIYALIDPRIQVGGKGS